MSARTLLPMLVLCGFFVDSGIAAGPLLEFETAERTYVGKSVAHNKSICWFAEPNGRMTQIQLKDVRSFRKLDRPFRSVSGQVLQDELRTEFGSAFEVVSKGKFIVCAPRGQAAACARLLDGVHRSFSSHFSRRGFRLDRPEFPLVAVVFPNQVEFAQYCRKDGVRFSATLQGYYSPESNRIAFYSSGQALSHAVPPVIEETDLLAIACRRSRPLSAQPASPNLVAQQSPFELPPVLGTIEGDLKDTIVHEATHQLAFNTGLHTRIGDNPRWVVEGLAMLLEDDSSRSDSRSGDRSTRVNQHRFEWFVRKNLRDVPMTDLIADDRYFARSGLNAYSYAWALSFFLTETRSYDYAGYLKAIRGRDPLTEYTSQQRLADFQKAFGKDLGWLQVQFGRFIDELTTE
ncbi:hypothetical protein Mal4_28250 [Maioricimonas rarisocia]|uniref:DUF1570 domain-containing protein n=1 Tax=Maioricimonas rarisocia TaxID=2528026 RepID=A0A517Z7N5_9PLAN|nr:DUF1570 domain-containing protein [Maioricimonas rarisocia]QDU38497.1 hypothetical protein Mal4_28250 [Maioricimonas rarisocia]